jgi:hypothetical protein
MRNRLETGPGATIVGALLLVIGGIVVVKGAGLIGTVIAAVGGLIIVRERIAAVAPPARSPSPEPPGDGPVVGSLPMDEAEVVVAKVVSGEPEAEVACGLLRSAGIECRYRETDAIDSQLEDFTAAGPREILVHADDLAAARELLG